MKRATTKPRADRLARMFEPATVVLFAGLGVTSQDRFRLVTVTIDGTTYVITDIAMRMLTPRELARAQGFPADYIIDRDIAGKPVSKADQVKLIGNSVCPQVAHAIAKSNVVDLRVFEDCGKVGAA